MGTHVNSTGPLMVLMQTHRIVKAAQWVAHKSAVHALLIPQITLMYAQADMLRNETLNTHHARHTPLETHTHRATGALRDLLPHATTA